MQKLHCLFSSPERAFMIIGCLLSVCVINNCLKGHIFKYLWIFTKLSRNYPFAGLFNNCSNGYVSGISGSNRLETCTKYVQIMPMGSKNGPTLRGSHIRKHIKISFSENTMHTALLFGM